MNAIHRNAARLLLTALAAGLIALIVAAVACGPAASSGQDNATPTPTIWIIDDTSPSELATVRARPTGTPWPPGYVPLTHRPYTPPLTHAEIGATLVAKMAAEAAQQAGGASEPTPTLTPTATPPLDEQVTQFTRDMQGTYDIVARVRAGTTRTVAIPDDVIWPHNQEPHFENIPGYDSFVRTAIRPITVYYGYLPEDYEIVVYPALPNGVIEEHQEYILFIDKVFVSAEEYPEKPPGKFLYNETQLDAIGGKAGVMLARQSWVVDGSETWRIPVDHITHGPAGSDLAAAKAGGESLSLSDLEAAIRQGLPQENQQ